MALRMALSGRYICCYLHRTAITRSWHLFFPISVVFLPPSRGLGTKDEVLVRPPATSMRFSDFLDLIEIAAQPQGPTLLTETFYLEYLSLAQYLGPDMLAMIPMPKPAQQAGMEHLLTNFWMGKGKGQH